MDNATAKPLFERVVEILSKSSHVEWKTLERLKEFFNTYKWNARVELDQQDQKCLRVALPEEVATDENISKMAQHVKSIVTDAEVTPIGVPMVNPMLTSTIPVATRQFKVGEKVPCLNTDSLPGNEVAPNLEKDKEYEVLGIELDSRGNQHLDVGIKSSVSFVRSYETTERLPKSNEIHFCHPSRFGEPLPTKE